MRLRSILLLASLGITIWSCKTAGTKSNLASEPAADVAEFKEPSTDGIVAATALVERETTAATVRLAAGAATTQYNPNIDPAIQQKWGQNYQAFGQALFAAFGGAATVISWYERESIKAQLLPLYQYLSNVGNAIKQSSGRSSQRISAIPANIAEIVRPFSQRVAAESAVLPFKIEAYLHKLGIQLAAASEESGDSMRAELQASADSSVDGYNAVVKAFGDASAQAHKVSQNVHAALLPYVKSSVTGWQNLMKYLSALPGRSSGASSAAADAVASYIYSRVLDMYGRSIVAAGLVRAFVTESVKDSKTWSSTKWAAFMSAVSKAFAASAKQIKFGSIVATHYTGAFSSFLINKLVGSGMWTVAQAKSISAGISTTVKDIWNSAAGLALQIWTTVKPHLGKASLVAREVSGRVLNMIYQSYVSAKGVSSSVYRVIEPLLMATLGSSGRVASASGNIVMHSLGISLEPFKSSYDIVKMFGKAVWETVVRVYLPLAAATKLSIDNSVKPAWAKTLASLARLQDDLSMMSYYGALYSADVSEDFKTFMTNLGIKSSDKIREIWGKVVIAAQELRKSSAQSARNSAGRLWMLSTKISNILHGLKLGISQTAESSFYGTIQIAAAIAGFVIEKGTKFSGWVSKQFVAFIDLLKDGAKSSGKSIKQLWLAAGQSVRAAGRSSADYLTWSGKVFEDLVGTSAFVWDWVVAPYVRRVSQFSWRRWQNSVWLMNQSYNGVYVSVTGAREWARVVSGDALKAIVGVATSARDISSAALTRTIAGFKFAFGPSGRFSNTVSGAFIETVYKPYAGWMIATSGKSGSIAVAGTASLAIGYGIYHSFFKSEPKVTARQAKGLIGGNADLANAVAMQTENMTSIYDLAPNDRAEVQDRLSNHIIDQGIKANFNPDEMGVDVARVIEGKTSPEMVKATAIIDGTIQELGYEGKPDDADSPVALARKAQSLATTGMILEQACKDGNQESCAAAKRAEEALERAKTQVGSQNY